MDRPYAVYLTGDRILVWDKHIAAALRRDHRIVGECTQLVLQQHRSRGSKRDDDEQEEQQEEQPERPAREYYASMPVYLSPQQAWWLLSRAVIRLLDGSSIQSLRSARFPAGQDAAAASREERLTVLRQHIAAAAAAHADRQQQQSSAASPSSSSSSAPPSSLLSTAATEQSSSSSSSSPYPAASTAALLLSLSPACSLSSVPALTLTHVAAPPPQLQPSSDPASVQRLSALLSQPPSSPALTAVWRSLHEAGFTVTGGEAYGGDYLLYDHDPADCHAHSVVVVVAKDEEERDGAEEAADDAAGWDTVDALELLTLARVGWGVKKNVVIALVDGEAERDESAGKQERQQPDVSFLSLHWDAAMSKLT